MRLKIMQTGEPVLREEARLLTLEEISAGRLHCMSSAFGQVLPVAELVFVILP